IKANGVLQPLLLRPIKATDGTATRYEIIAGERRWRASQLAKLHKVPAIIQEMTDLKALEISFIENLQRQDLNALEESQGYQRLIDEFGHSQEQLAKSLGKSRSHITNMLRLLQLPPEIKTFLEQGQITAGHARALLSANDPAALAKEIIE